MRRAFPSFVLEIKSAVSDEACAFLANLRHKIQISFAVFAPKAHFVHFPVLNVVFAERAPCKEVFLFGHLRRRLGYDEAVFFVVFFYFSVQQVVMKSPVS